MTCHRRAAVVAGFAKMVLSGAIIRPIAEGQPVSKEKHRIAEQAHSALMGDKERARKLMVAAFAHGVTTGCRMPLSARPSRSRGPQLAAALWVGSSLTLICYVNPLRRTKI